MSNVYLKFHELKTRKIHENDLHEFDLGKYQYIYYDEPYYILKENIYIGSLDKKERFGFLRQPTDDIFIEGFQLKDAMHNDIIIVEYKKDAKVLEVIKRDLEFIVATVHKRRKGFKYFTDKPLGKEILIDDESKIVDGNIVKLEVVLINEKNIYAKLVEIIGHVNDPDIEILKIVATHNWPHTDYVTLDEEIANLNIDFEKEKSERLDLTNELTFTIDGIDAKDLDDAISLKMENGNYVLGVHIADVSLFVPEGSLLDKSAYSKSTSVYMANKVIPMLPHKISNDLCSLNPNEEKLTLSCIMEIDKNGKLIKYDISKSFIKSKHRLNYDDVNLFLHENKTLGSKELDDTLLRMNELSQILSKNRRKRGEIEFHSEEIKFVFDDDNNVVDIYTYETDIAEGIIESFMLMANETVAFHMEHAELPSIYRIHEAPDTDRLTEALDRLSRLGISVNRRAMHQPSELQKVTNIAKDSPHAFVINMTLLRAMQRARYDKTPVGHFGLAARHYTHFTSPIRRYPDLYLHRIIKDLVLGEANNLVRKMNYYEKNLEEVSKHTSVQERVAVDIERDVIKLKSCEYLLDKINHRFKGQIIQMLKSGMFVRLENGIEGFVSMKNGNNIYDENLLAFRSEGKLYKLGDVIDVELVDVNMLDLEIDFKIVKKEQEKKNNKGNNKNRRRRKR